MLRERRKHLRVPDSSVVIVKRLSDNGAGGPEGGYLFTTADIAADGVQVQRAQAIPQWTAGMLVELRIATQEPRATFKHIGRIRWCRQGAHTGQFSLGIEFENACETAWHAWLRFLAQRARHLPRSGVTQACAEDPQSIWLDLPHRH